MEAAMRSKMRANMGSEMPYMCKSCGKCFRFINYLWEHLRLHNIHIPVQRCIRCNELFTEQSEMRNHIRSHSCEMKIDPMGQFGSERAEFLFPSSGLLAYDAPPEIEGLNGPHICGLCPRTFAIKMCRNVHCAMHHPNDIVNPFFLLASPALPPKLRAIRRRIEERVLINPNVCPICGVQFDNSEYTEAHVMVVHMRNLYREAVRRNQELRRRLNERN